MSCNQKLYETSKCVQLNIGGVAFLEHEGKAWTVVGSCLCVCLYSKKMKVAAICHAQLPKQIIDRSISIAESINHCINGITSIEENRYMDKVLFAMFYFFEKKNIPLHTLTAVLIGGASAYGLHSNGQTIGESNVDMARKILKQNKIDVVFEDVGGRSSRNIYYDNLHGQITINKSKTIIL